MGLTTNFILQLLLSILVLHNNKERRTFLSTLLTVHMHSDFSFKIYEHDKQLCISMFMPTYHSDHEMIDKQMVG
jgi:hypothetical protein